MKRTLLTFGLGILIASSTVGADDADMADPPTKVGDIVIHQAWARPSLGNTPNSAAYMTVETAGEDTDRLLGGSSPIAGRVGLHTHLMENGIAKMRPVEAIEVAPGTPTVLEPGGLHLMLMGLEHKLVEGESMPLTLVFERAGEVTLAVRIRMTAGMSHGAGGHGGTEESPKTN